MKGTYIFVILLILGIFAFVGVLIFSGIEQDKESNLAENSVDADIEDDIVVDVIDDEDDEEVEIETPTVNQPTDNDEDKEEDEEKPVVTKPGDTTKESLKTVGTATAADSVNVSGYSYYIEDGSLYFELIVSQNTPKAEAYYSGNDIVLAFPSVLEDYIAKNGDFDQDLGNLLPSLEVSRSGEASEYRFVPKSDVRKTFDLKNTKNDDGKNVVRIIIQL